MEPVDIDTGAGRFSLVTESPDDVPGPVGVAQVRDVEPATCPDCGLVRLYADGR